jgi:hypothetical protein
MTRSSLAMLPRIVVLGFACVLAQSASADPIKLNFSSVFSGTAPAGTGPWLTATFTDVVPGTVTLEVVAGGLTGTESIDGLYFNLNPALNPASLTFTRNATSTGPTAANTTISLGSDGFRADGDGFYDIFFQLPPPPGSQAARFTAGETLIYQISGIAGLNAASFAWLSTPGPGGGPGPQIAAAHVQGIGSGGSGSGWVGATQAVVPVPAAFGLLASGLGMLLVRRRRVRAQLAMQGLGVDGLDQVPREAGLV